MESWPQGQKGRLPERADDREQGRTRSLTVREVQVVRLIATGATNDEIAADLSVARGTVHSYVERALAKTGARNRTQLAVLAVLDGLFPEPEQEPADPLDRRAS